jgi:hypothetical protein
LKRNSSLKAQHPFSLAILKFSEEVAPARESRPNKKGVPSIKEEAPFGNSIKEFYTFCLDLVEPSTRITLVSPVQLTFWLWVWLFAFINIVDIFF